MDEMILQVEKAMLELGRCRPDDLIVIAAGTLPVRAAPPTWCGSTGWVRAVTG
jgi:hypothetical protein